MSRDPRNYDLSRILRYAPEELIGREAELRRLSAAWADPRQHILTLVASGGEGKTSLAAKWAIDQMAQGWPDCEAAFAWSFYSQGSRDQNAASSDIFLKEALNFFGDADDKAFAASSADGHEKGRRLARAVGQTRALLILDGLEPLQYPPGSPMPGQLRDDGLRALLRGLAQHNRGLCLITTRVSIPDLKAFRHATAPEEELKSLSPQAGADLLKKLGVRGGADELAALVKDVHGHALTLTVMGRFLARAYAGDIRQRDRVKFDKADERVDGGHAFRAMAAYERWLLADGGPEGQREVAVLKLLGLFDRPADAACLAALRREPIPGLTEPLDGISEEDWAFCLSGLAGARLLTVNRDGAGALLALDAHPLLREYFAKQLKEASPAAWRAAHRRIYQHLCDTTREGNQPTLEDLQPLYQAVAHGCLAGLHQETCDNVYFVRLLRRDGFYSTRKLGAFGSDLGAVACFFDPPWSRVSPALSPDDQAWLLNEAAFRLRTLGRLGEALEPMRAGLEMRVNQKNWRQAAIVAGNVSELELTLGELGAAVSDAAQAVTYADQSSDAFQRMGNLTTHADALHHAGRLAEALALFREAEAIQAERQPEYRLLYSLAGFRYGEALLAEPERAAGRRVKGEERRVKEWVATCDEVRKRGQKMFEWRLPSDSILDIALDHLTLGRAALYAAVLAGSDLTAAQAELEQAVSGLRKAGTQHELPRGLLSRAWARAAAGQPALAQENLDEAWEIAQRGPMRLFMADIHLYRARLFGAGAAYPAAWGSPAQDLAAARALIHKCGYWRREEELEDAERELSERDLTGFGNL